jgi:SAM-dependent methyltransferase
LVQTIEQWWEICHNTPGSFFVSNYGGPSLWEAMNIVDRVHRWKRILEIGVGGGEDVRQLRKIGCRVYALDITRAALERVKGSIKRGWLDPADLPAGRFDLAISHLVTQHMSNADLERQIRHVLRSLKKGGLFALQFADHPNGVTDDAYNESLEHQQGGGVCRNLGMIEATVRKAEGRIAWVSAPIDFPDYGSRWFYVHIRKSPFSCRTHPL